ncbi:c-type cytochrome biogenesis protein CcmI [Psychromarinibacter sp. C21-152]|uniref:C-type cytochrome biogenesis protein CcmI n=1 Tax=Psychromarinibacter sediminicola TaxID=3033385 RepID=A0AAE3TBB7_9RHOB|nr:c-type cytochrome biogenesis protein CcmI [Psychromarinibacter sediminicola]MDF0602515.1 c-type cytochrome biogenesis protein CcmI [Psychromarinibacter sediminicola]
MAEWAFWIVAGLLALLVAALMLLALMRGRRQATPAAAYDVQVYRDQLAEVERDLARGVVTEDEAQRTRTEVSRRLLEADRAAQAARAAGTAPRPATYGAAALVVAILAGSFGVYYAVGAPGYPDLPLSARLDAAEERRANRPDQETAEAQALARLPEREAPDERFTELMDRLRAALEENPDDLQGLQLLVVNEARLGNFKAAYEAQERRIEVMGEDATATDWADLADLMVLAAGGYVSPEAEAAIDKALEMDPDNGPARYYSGVTYAQTGRPDRAFEIWRGLLQDSRMSDPWVQPILQQMPRVAALAGERWSPPEAAAPERGPTAADMEAAADMAPEDRRQMIQNMVDGLADRLASEGGPPEDWARLIGALGVLEETERAAAIWDEAQGVFADAPDALQTIRAAALRAGVAE